MRWQACILFFLFQHGKEHAWRDNAYPLILAKIKEMFISTDHDVRATFQRGSKVFVVVGIGNNRGHRPSLLHYIGNQTKRSDPELGIFDALSDTFGLPKGAKHPDATKMFLGVLGSIAAKAGGASVLTGALRVTFWG